MNVTLSGILIEVKPVQFSNVFFPMDFTLSFIITDLTLSFGIEIIDAIVLLIVKWNPQFLSIL